MHTEPTGKRPKSVERWRKAHDRRKGICAQRCPKHRGGTPGFCERKEGHAGMHGHLFLEGMTEPDGSRSYDETRPWRGCSWLEPPAPPSTPRRGKPTSRGPLDAFGGDP